MDIATTRRSKVPMPSNMVTTTTVMHSMHTNMVMKMTMPVMIINQMPFVTLRGRLSDASALVEQITTSTCSMLKEPKEKT